MAKTVKVGDKAPFFSLVSDKGETIYLSGLIGKSPIVLFFYPKNNTSVCTKEACEFRDRYDELNGLKALIFGISSDSLDSHKEFSSKQNLPFTLLSDPGSRVRKLYGVTKTLGILPGRVTYIIDKKGIVRHIFSSQLDYKKHVEEAVKALESINQN